MEFVFSSWLILALALVCCIAVCLIIFFKMNKTDAKLTDEFVKKQYDYLKQKEETDNKNN